MTSTLQRDEAEPCVFLASGGPSGKAPSQAGGEDHFARAEALAWRLNPQQHRYVEDTLVYGLRQYPCSSCCMKPGHTWPKCITRRNDLPCDARMLHDVFGATEAFTIHRRLMSLPRYCQGIARAVASQLLSTLFFL